MNWRQVWTHQCRWARTIRVCQPLPFFLSILNNATLWPLLWLAATRQSGRFGRFAAVACCFASCTALHSKPGSCNRLPPRLFLDAAGQGYAGCRCLGRRIPGNHVTWRGQRYRIFPGGKLEKVAQG